MTTTEEAVKTETTQMYRVWINATPEAIWDAITSPEWTDRYGYGGIIEYGDALTAGSEYKLIAGPEMIEAGFTGSMVEGRIVESDPPKRFVQTWQLVMNPELADEPVTTVAYDIQPQPKGVTRLTVTHELDNAPKTAYMVAGHMENPETGEAGGGWAWILSDLKSLLETGEPLGKRATES
jgi:uncharacterized protein YndB with AHSA1/START domain